ncbi:hypothetical protein ACFXK0_20735 [Nocardia sp. NPDC059177]|uniref:hypothetical protein n=1 Tax=Nocardia sp. NPDC059177 TaxID=3346759 RepID=UPI0036D1C24C
MTSTTDPVDLLVFALSEQRTVTTDPTGSVTVELTASGAITAIRLTESGHRMTPAMVAELIMSLHTAGLAQAQKAIEAALADAEVPTIPEPDLGDTPATPATPAAAEQTPTVPTDVPTVERSSEPALPNPPPLPAPAERTVEQPARDLPSTARNPATEWAAHPPHTAATAPPQIPRPGPGPAPGYADDPGDEDEYFRALSVFEYDDHRPRG